MRNHIQTPQSLEKPRDLNERIDFVMNVQKKLGYVSRQALIEMYGFTQQQAGSLMRDFIHAHAKDLEWNTTHSHYILKR